MPKSMAFAAALALVSGCAAGLPSDLAGILARGERAEAEGDENTARIVYSRAVREYPEYAASWAYYGEYQRFWKADLASAEASFQKALAAPSTDPKSIAFAWRGLGEIARARGDIERAIELLNKSLSVEPLVETHRSLSALYANEKGDFVRAAEHARSALAASPDDPIALLQYAVQLIRAGRRDEAAQAFSKAVKIAGCDETGSAGHAVHCCVLYNGACYHAVRGDRERAVAMLAAFFKTPNHRHLTRREVFSDPDFAAVLDDPEFVALLDRFLPK